MVQPLHLLTQREQQVNLNRWSGGSTSPAVVPPCICRLCHEPPEQLQLGCFDQKAPFHLHNEPCQQRAAGNVPLPDGLGAIASQFDGPTKPLLQCVERAAVELHCAYSEVDLGVAPTTILNRAADTPFTIKESSQILKGLHA